MSAGRTAPSPIRQRTASKQARRTQLIEATIDVLAEKGLSSLTISDVARQAGLSHGIVNFHFISKDELLRETILEMERRFRLLMEQALEEAAGDPVASIRGMAHTEFCDALSEERIMRAWATFRSEVPQLYHSVCKQNDEHFFGVLVEKCGEICAEDALINASIIDATVKGLVQRQLLASLTQNEALSIMNACLHAVFPDHFPRKASGPSAIRNRTAAARKSQRVVGQKTNRPDKKAKRQKSG